MPRVGREATARKLVLRAERRFRRAGLHYGHGTDNARDEAVFLVFHALGLPFDSPDSALDRPLDPAAQERVAALVDSRLTSRRPAAYLTGRMWFAGHEFEVNEDVLVPRSPIAELIRGQFHPWLATRRVERILDIGTGSGCIGIAAGLAFPRASVDATDISPAALAVAARNVTRHALESRLRLHLADLFPPSATGCYDLILTNPPYVPFSERAELPAEYLHEPALALFAAEDGLEFLRRIFASAAGRLTPGGILVFDAGATWPRVESAFRELGIVWAELRQGGDGIGIVSRSALAQLPLQ